MFIFFGTRASPIKTRKVEGNTTCPYCQSKGSFAATTFGKYFHILWIPFLPLPKMTILECAHCEKTYTIKELPQEIGQALNKTDALKPPKRPLWQGCGCLILAAIGLIIVVLSIASALFWRNKEVNDVIDARSTYLHADIEKATIYPDKDTDSISYKLKKCIDYDVEGIDTEKIGYYSKLDHNKLLILLQVNDLRKTEAASRKELVFAIEDCLASFLETKGYQVYIGVNGKWNMVLVKTPVGESMGGKFAKSNMLLPFYGEKPILKP